MKIKDLKRMERHQAYQEKVLPIGEDMVEAMQAKLIEKEVSVILSYHEKEREFERAVSREDVLRVLEDGYVIEVQGIQKDRKGNLLSIDVLLMSYVKITKGYRPLHVAVNLKQNEITVKTVYDPRSREWQWEDNYENLLTVKKW